MSRSNYSDDFGDDYPGQIHLYRANVDRSIRSKAGQMRLRELRDALLALPTKELHPEIFAQGTSDKPEVCALGAWAVTHCGLETAKTMVPEDGDDHDTFSALKSHGWPKLVVWEAVYMNDEAWLRDPTPSGRYRYMLAWVNENITDGDDRP